MYDARAETISLIRSGLFFHVLFGGSLPNLTAFGILRFGGKGKNCGLALTTIIFTRFASGSLVSSSSEMGVETE